jgi:hypothetical protein
MLLNSDQRRACCEINSRSFPLFPGAFFGAAVVRHLHMPGKHLLRATIRARELVEDREVMRKVLDHDSVMYGVVTGGSKTERSEKGVPRMTDFAVNQQEPAAVGGAERCPGARVHPEAYATRHVEWDKDEQRCVVAAWRIRCRRQD